jgi:hypothetical protein
VVVVVVRVGCPAYLRARVHAQKNYKIVPGSTRKYTITTLGKADTLLALYKRVGDKWEYVAADDDSGKEYNAKIEVGVCVCGCVCVCVSVCV